MRKISMKLVTIFAIVLCSNLLIAQITINGYTFLEHETNYQNIKIDFERTAPSSLTYTFYTDANGYFLESIETGIYNITYSKIGYYSIELIDEQLFSNTTLTDTTLKVNLCGQLSDAIFTGTYEINCDIEVANGDTLIIQPGVKFIFDGSTTFNVYGLLVAEGTESDSIIFTSTGSDWYGIKFNAADSNSILSYCIIENSRGGGISITNCSPTIKNSTVRNNTAKNLLYYLGGGLKLFYSNSVIDSVLIKNNEAWGVTHFVYPNTYNYPCRGGGIYCVNSSPTITNTILENNGAFHNGAGEALGGGIYCDNSDISFSNITISNGTGTGNGGVGIYICSSSSVLLSNGNIINNITNGIYSENSNLSVSNSLIKGNATAIKSVLNNTIITDTKITENNSSSDVGGGLSLDGGSVQAINTIISDNTASLYGGGIYLNNSNPNYIFTNLTIVDNSASSGGGIFCSGTGESNFTNCIIVGNTASSEAGGIWCNSSTNISYSNFFNNTPNNFLFCDTWIGNNVTNNLNGTDCDVYYNIQEDPMFENSGAGDYHLHTGSPCIDAGINDSITGLTDFDGNARIWDGDNNGTSIVDMGAFEVGLNIGNDITECGSAILTAVSGYSSYNWNNGLSNNDTLVVDTSGTYYVAITDSNSFTSYDTINVTIYPLPIVNLGNDTVVCGNITLKLIESYINYDWNSGLSANDSLNVTTTGDYYVFITDLNSCSNYSDTINITINSTHFYLGNESICNGDSILWHSSYYKTTGIFYDSLLTVSGCDSVYELDLIVNSIFYYTDNEEICDGDSLLWQGVYYNTTGQYFANYQTVNFCDSIYELNLIVNPTYNFVNYDSICDGDSLLWQGIYYKTLGQYFANYQTINFCDSVYELNLTINPTYSSVENESICDGDSLLWQGTYYNAIGQYFENYQTLNSCDSIYELNLNIIVVDTAVSQTDTILTANTTGASYQWLDCDNSFSIITGETNQLFTATANGNYAVEITENGCTDTSFCYSVTSVGVFEYSSNSYISIYPNPTTGKITIQAKCIEKIEIMNIQGKQIYIGIKNEIDLSNEPKGIYIIKVTTKKGVAVGKVVLE